MRPTRRFRELMRERTRPAHSPPPGQNATDHSDRPVLTSVAAQRHATFRTARAAARGLRAHARGAIPAGFLGMAVLIAAVEFCVAANRLSFTHIHHEMYLASAAAAKAHAPGCKALCMGDSLVKVGVAPAVLEDRLGGPVYNLAAMGSPPPMTYFLLRRALHAGARPRAIVVDFKASILATRPWLHARGWAETLSLPECAELAWTERDGSLFGAILSAKLMPSIAAREGIRACVLANLMGRETVTRGRSPMYARNWTRNQGAVIHPKDAATGRNPALIQKEVYYPDTWSAQPVNLTYIRRFLSLADEHQIAVFWLLPPIQPNVQALRDAIHADEAYLKGLRTLLPRYPGLTVIEGQHVGYPGTVFFDPAHLDREGAAALSAGVAEVVASSLDTSPSHRPRWVSLPAFEANPRAEAMLEDLRQSYLALQASADSAHQTVTR